MRDRIEYWLKLAIALALTALAFEGALGGLYLAWAGIRGRRMAVALAAWAIGWFLAHVAWGAVIRDGDKGLRHNETRDPAGGGDRNGGDQ